MSLLIKELLQMAQKRFELAGCSDPRIDAEQLLCYYLNENRSYLFLHYADEIGDSHCQGYLELIDRRASGEPIQYITGVQEFMGLEFCVNQDVLIPCQDTETLVELALDELCGRKTPFGGFEVLDLCCGSGAIGISLLKLGERGRLKLNVIGTDISEGALQVAQKNAEKNAVKPIRFLQGDLFAPLPKNRKGQGKQKFDLIISNPPYIPDAVIPTLQKEVREYEPILALSGGETGLDFYERIVPEAERHLKPGGLLMLEIGYDQGEALKQLAAASAFWTDAEVHLDLAGKDRVVILRASSEKI